MLVGISNFLVATCNFTVMYNFPTWFQTVMLTSASEAGQSSAIDYIAQRLLTKSVLGAHLIPNGISVSCGSLFAGYARAMALSMSYAELHACAAGSCTAQGSTGA